VNVASRLPNADADLRSGITLDALHQQANAISNLHAAQALNLANLELFRQISGHSTSKATA